MSANPQVQEQVIKAIFAKEEQVYGRVVWCGRRAVVSASERLSGVWQGVGAEGQCVPCHLEQVCRQERVADAALRMHTKNN